MDDEGKCNKVESVCVINNGNTKQDVNNSFTPDSTAHKHQTTNHKSLSSEVLQEIHDREELRRNPSNELRRSKDADVGSNSTLSHGDDEFKVAISTHLTQDDTKNLMG